MKSKWFWLLFTSIAFAAGIQHPQRGLAADEPATFTGEKTASRGFDRYDFLMELGGQITIIEKEGEGHFPLAPKDRQPVVDFIISRVGG